MESWSLLAAASVLGLRVFWGGGGLQQGVGGGRERMKLRAVGRGQNLLGWNKNVTPNGSEAPFPPSSPPPGPHPTQTGPHPTQTHRSGRARKAAGAFPMGTCCVPLASGGP